MQRQYARGLKHEFSRNNKADLASIATGGRPVPNLEWVGGKFVHQPPAPQPYIMVGIEVMKASMGEFGKRLDKSMKMTATAAGLSDTGAQSCSCGIELMKALGVKKGDLLPTSHGIRGITGGRMRILGALLVKITSRDKFSRAMMYVCEEDSGVLLSRSVLSDLGLINSSFPSLGASTNSAASKSTCNCPERAATPPLPDKLPYPATDENRARLEAWIKQYYASSAFNTCEHQPLQKLTGPPLDITFKEGAEPVAVHTPIAVAYHWKKEVKENLDRDVRLGVIEQVPAGTPTTWCSRMVVAPKPHTGKPRRTVDLQAVNRVSMRETHHTDTPHHMVSAVPTNQKKTVLDAWNGYHAMELSEKARDASTFITEWGRYRYLRAPQGFHAAGDGYTKRTDDITVDVVDKKKCIDDTLLYKSTMDEIFWHTVEYIDLCSRNGIIFNPDKFHFGEDEIEFAGFELTKDGFRPTKNALQSIANFPVPSSLTDIRSWFGLVEQVSYAFSKSKVMAPFRELLQKSKPFYWDDQLTTLFKQARVKVTELVRDGVKLFDLNRWTAVMTDWSGTGVGFFLVQKHCECDLDLGPKCGKGHWWTVNVGSRFLKDAETRYKPIEGEALAIVYGLESNRMYCLGNEKLLVYTDHKPLVPIMNDRKLELIKNPRVRSLKDKTLMYSFETKHIAGKEHVGPDVASRYPGLTSSTRL